jgi:formylglycine-generating enzyme required for sulfatase activity
VDEVTLEDWRQFVDDSKIQFDWEQRLTNNIAGGGPPEARDPQTAMYHITWYEAVKYANWLSSQLGFEQVYEITENGSQTIVTWHHERTGFRLPTEAEWEYAARGGSAARETKYAGSNSIGEVAWYIGNSDSRVHEVGKKRPNELGIFDMTGNVSEWCWDYFDVTYTPHGVTDPTGPSTGRAPGLFESQEREQSARVFRGCDFFAFEDWCEIATRDGNPANNLWLTGVRLAMSGSGTEN